MSDSGRRHDGASRTAILTLAVAAVALTSCGDTGVRVAGVPDTIDYNWHVRPILSENCFQCHGNDPESLEAGLRLDTAESALAELRDWAGHYAIVPGEPDSSELMRRVTAANEEDRMPPPSTRKTLSPAEIEILRRWIGDGAIYRKHWAFITPVRPAVPDDASILELAQASVPEVADISDEPESVLNMYGPDVHLPGTFARNCLIARRLAEPGVKFTTLFGMGWDHHLAIRQNFPLRCREINQPSAALVLDLKQRGLLEDTLVMFGSEFGRTPFAQGDLDSPVVGRDHHGGCFTWWLAGAGVKAGYTHGETDEFAYNVVADPVHIHDLNATLMHLFGIDHERLTFRFQGRDYRLTDVHGEVVRAILA